jgi:peptidoglycan/xylan/chitin deacetylase (PgdA/CDA1 family)
MQKSEQAFINVLGHKTKLFRPPYGNANATVRSTIEYPLINWNVDTLDWKSRNADKVVAHIRSFQSCDGKIILMHSIYNSTVKATEIIVPELIAKGYQLVTVSELAYYKGFETLSNGVIYREFKP